MLPTHFHFFWRVNDGLVTPACYAENVTLEKKKKERGGRNKEEKEKKKLRKKREIERREAKADGVGK